MTRWRTSTKQTAEGIAWFTQPWNGATRRFASAADPTQLAPQHGVYSAGAAISGKMYLNYNQGCPIDVAAADKNWPRLHK